MAKKSTNTKKKKQTSIGQGWLTTDSDEIQRRKNRAETEKLKVKKSAWPDEFQVLSATRQTYTVEFRSKTIRKNSCDCPDYQTNGLGTCKHIERVLRFVKNKKAPEYPNRIEIFLERRVEESELPYVRVIWPEKSRLKQNLYQIISPFFSADNQLLADPTIAIPALLRSIEENNLGKQQVRFSEHIYPWLNRLNQKKLRDKHRSAFLADVAEGKRSLELVKFPLYEYQERGMLHLAFAERAILADEMGLGKTIQAISAAVLLSQLRGIKKVLVISPTSLKSEWEEQIGKFSDMPTLLIQGNRAERLKRYQQDSFFYLMNYEQIRYDQDEIQRLIEPDLIILDEAQRIKNWQTKTAQSVKRLSSPFLFVLTGTPIENRIDEIYSIVQAIDPHLFGPLFRFNREFYRLDEKGKACGHKNLRELHRRLKPILLRRRKSDIDEQLPGRTINTYFVEMHEEQEIRYAEYNEYVCRIAARAKHRPLSPEEFKKLQMFLACMRMLCDTPYILDKDCRISPKLEEIKIILGELLSEPKNKLIIFSEWTSMLDLIREHLESKQIGYALHTGQVAQKKRREVINRFKQDDNCRIFLSSDAGATGLNLQVANIVINVDLPWNPAKLEQRIARAWRKHQKRPVSVINLVCENSIEQRIMHMLEQKQSLADGILDGNGEDEMDMPSGRKVFMERLGNLMDIEIVGESQEKITELQESTFESPQKPAELIPDKTPTLIDGYTNYQPANNIRTNDEHVNDARSTDKAVVTQSPDISRLPDEIESRHPGSLQQMDVYKNNNGKQTLFSVIKGDINKHQQTLSEQLKQQTDISQLEIIDQNTMSTIQRLIDAGVLSLNKSQTNLFNSTPTLQQKQQQNKQWLEQARKRFGDSEHKLKMAEVLANGGFLKEAIAPMVESMENALASLFMALTGKKAELVSIKQTQLILLPKANLPEEVLSILAVIRDELDTPDDNTFAEMGKIIRLIDEKLLEWVMSST